MTDQQRYDKLVKSCKKHMSKTPHMIDGVEFWQVGRNASHEFYVGKLGPFFLQYAIGEGLWPEEEYYKYDMGKEPPLDRSLYVFKTFDELARTYMGHF